MDERYKFGLRKVIKKLNILIIISLISEKQFRDTFSKITLLSLFPEVKFSLKESLDAYRTDAKDSTV